jgi:replicative DNA helicase
VTGNVAPHDLDAEAAVISACILSPDALAEASDILRPDMFYAVANERIFEAVLAVDAEYGRVDSVLVARRLKDSERLAQVGGTPYLAQIVEATPAIAHVTHHARIVAERAYQRRLIAELQRSAAEGYGAADGWEWGQDTERRIFDAANAIRKGSDPGSMDVLIPQAVDAVRARSKGETTQGGRIIPTGLRSLDRKLIGGGWSVNKYVIAGRPGMGKSAMALAAVAATAAAGYAAVLVSAEMPAEQIALRLLSQESGVLNARISGAKNAMRDGDWSALMGHVPRIQALPMSIVYCPGATTAQVRGAVRRELARLRRIHGSGLELGMIAIDHVHIMNGERQRGENDAGELTRLSKGNLWMVGEFGCTVLELAQLNRGVESRPDKRPNLSDLRGAGSLEEDAHTILFPFRSAYYDKDRKVNEYDDNAAPDECEIIVAKQRGGGTGSVRVMFHGHTLRFIESAEVPDGNEDFFDNSEERYR